MIEEEITELTGVISFPFEIGGFLKDTMHLDTLEVGIYLKLLIAHYQSGEKGLLLDDKRLSLIAGVTPKVWSRVKPTIMEYFYIKNSQMLHKKVIEVLRKVHEKSAKQRSKALKRHNSTPATAELRDCQTKPKPNIDNINIIIGLMFDEFWELYPRQRRGNKQKAKVAYEKAIKENRATEEQIIEGVKLYAQSEEVANGYAKGAAAWLNDDRWANEYKPEEKYIPVSELKEGLSGWRKELAKIIDPTKVKMNFKDVVFDGKTMSCSSAWQKDYIGSHFGIDIEKVFGKVEIK